MYHFPIRFPSAMGGYDSSAICFERNASMFSCPRRHKFPHTARGPPAVAAHPLSQALKASGSLSHHPGTNAPNQPWLASLTTALSLIQKAANESGLDSAYFKQVLRRWAMHLWTYFVWYSPLKAVLEPTPFLSWKSLTLLRQKFKHEQTTESMFQ